ncbi:MAG TPA: DUF1868 domain-containing protein [Cyanobacteria bacterium UBA11149]|nr:DUF1868 domain-containing protein [Cyanobacteria bacterium UBA11367]HBE59007.1 DUF1868 domain-containing protein [Cyanobacteria bacterium UBA11366]HBK62767.1 DUF1868 domain-containing protein [Cyanobacteria bacterium UBA11166]HBR75940.1 DUF1868 domain-containing protein [Cyanobacteria bacterium UBA11159]HBS70562.1 DUF1868 domain-containing protein [Cyanobacteria bacterium UBA11153]HBW91175.1 DUF1868 domain-containing protein [Cyanobacteria bacterium UBA11149]HCA94721.1 DUF1868 domain-conta
MDDTYQAYLNRVTQLTLPAMYQSQLPHIQESPKFKPLSDGTRQAVPFPGCTLVTPPWGDESENGEFYTNLQQLQEQLSEQLDPGLMIPLPPDSFHLTLADLIWNDAYQDAQRENPQFEPQLHQRISDSFQKYQEAFAQGNPIGWQLLGLMIMPRAVGVCLAPKDEDSYQRILYLRRAIYQNPGLIALGIEQQYHFTAHVTLGYFGEIPAHLDRDRITGLLSDFNQKLLEKEGTSFFVRRGELRKFDDMMRYYREADWPVLEF